MTKLYAEGTQVPVESTRAEIEKLVKRYGADLWATAETVDADHIAFRMGGRRLRFTVKRPTEKDVSTLPSGRLRPRADWHAALLRERMRRWRSLLLLLRAKLEIVTSGGEPLESEFLANIVDDGGQTVYEWARPRLVELYGAEASTALVVRR